MVFFYSSLAITCVVFLIRMLTDIETDYRYMQLIHTWPQTYCRQNGVQCDTSIPSDFTLHGLWPVDAAGNSLTCPDLDPERNLTALFNSLPDLPALWPWMNRNVPQRRLWYHEYSKHGVCVKPVVDEIQYFTAAIQIWRSINLLAVFQSENIIPSHHIDYSMWDTIRAVGKAIKNNNANVYISCRPINETHAMLFEVYTCLNPTLTADASCPLPTHGRPQQRNCYHDQYGYPFTIILPPPS